MPLAVTVQLPVSSKDPRDIVSGWIALVRANATNLDALQVRIGLTSTVNAGILLQLAERLPLMALGFQQFSGRTKTAGEFRAQYSPGICGFNGLLTDHFSASDALLLLEELLCGPAAAIRSTAFAMHASNVAWKGAPPGSFGSIDLFDLKAFQRKNRFSFTASLEWHGEDSKSPETREILERVSRATGISFDKESIYCVPGKERWTEASAHAVLVGQICFDEVLEEAADEIPAGLISSLTPRALPHGQAWSSRLEQWGSGTSDRVDFVRLVKRAIKETFPEWKFRSSDADAVVFANSSGGQAEGLLSFYKSNPRLGKAFTVLLGIESTKTSPRFEANIYRLERSTEQKSWIYNTVEEASAAVNESLAAVRQIWPTFRSAVRAYFEPWPKDLPNTIPQHGSLTAREAYDKALPLARKQFADARLIRIFNRCRSLEARSTLGPELSFNGRLPANAAWWFHFHSPGQDISFEVNVPFSGRIQVLTHGEQYRSVNGRRYLTPVGDDWLDSDRVLALAEERGGRERRSSRKTWGLLTKLIWGNGQAYWAVNYLVSDERGRNDLILNMDAATGEPLMQRSVVRV